VNAYCGGPLKKKLLREGRYRCCYREAREDAPAASPEGGEKQSAGMKSAGYSPSPPSELRDAYGNWIYTLNFSGPLRRRFLPDSRLRPQSYSMEVACGF